ncbi:MAG: phosphoglycolate phosphatase [Lautropia sp.]|nr:phosphoglycolate phosphatase [Lautropia sp.]
MQPAQPVDHPPAHFQLRLAAIRALCFDLDGTLLDTIPDLTAAANGMLKDLGLNPRPEDEVATYVGKGADRLIARMLASAGQPADLASELFARARQIFYAHYRHCNGKAARLYPGVASGLKRMADLGLPMACVTNKPQEFVQPLLLHFHLRQYFDFFIGGDTLPVRKPDPGPLLEAAHRWCLDPGQVLMVGDSLNDAQAARAARMPVVMLPYGYNEGQPLSGVDADALVAGLDCLADWLEMSRGLPVNTRAFS